MDDGLSRRALLGVLGATGIGAGLGSSATAKEGKMMAGTTKNPIKIVGGKVIQPQREVPVFRETDVLVVGGGPSGVAAAVAARRTGANVTLIERYGCFGGLWTGGLVLKIPGVCFGKKQVTMGICEDILQRLDKMDQAVIERDPGEQPTVDAEATKYVLSEMIREAGVDVYLHSWGVDVIMDGNVVKGAVFESKSGRFAVLAKMVIDASGDGDIFSIAGAPYEHRRHRIGLVCRIGNMDKIDRAKAKQAKKPPRGIGLPTPIPSINWVNMGGRESDAVDVNDLTRLEMDHRRQIWRQMDKLRKTPGYEKVYLVEVASQLGVRISRVLTGMKQVTFKGAKAGQKFPDVIGVGGELSPGDPLFEIPFGALVPRKVENILAVGRCASAGPVIMEPMRCIPCSLVTGHAAGVASALAVQDGCRCRDVEIPKLQKRLKEQGAYLG
ncbi:MAG: FAD-dependent oxidoreductase [Planctomycetota bacterium]|nr:FAD-dependent oxidoreductase [Planctomycetota bacterium]